jgi:hypothetical protein
VNPDLFLAPFTESDTQIKILEVYDEDVYIHTGKFNQSSQGGAKELQIDRTDSHKIIGFPHRLCESPYHVYKLFSPDFSQFIDWSHSIDGY